MMIDFKDIHIGDLVRARAQESGIEELRISKFLKCDSTELATLYNSKSMDTETLLRFSKLFKYDFFRIYSHHLILYSPVHVMGGEEAKAVSVSGLPNFRKNIYTREIIDFLLELIETGKKSRLDVVEEYKIPKTTLYKWIEKYGRK